MPPRNVAQAEVAPQAVPPVRPCGTAIHRLFWFYSKVRARTAEVRKNGRRVGMSMGRLPWTCGLNGATAGSRWNYGGESKGLPVLRAATAFSGKYRRDGDVLPRVQPPVSHGFQTQNPRPDAPFQASAEEARQKGRKRPIDGKALRAPEDRRLTDCPIVGSALEPAAVHRRGAVGGDARCRNPARPGSVSASPDTLHGPYPANGFNSANPSVPSSGPPPPRPGIGFPFSGRLLSGGLSSSLPGGRLPETLGELLPEGAPPPSR